MFNKVGAEARPISICVGTLKTFGNLQHSKHDPENPTKTIYCYNNLEIAAARNSGSDIRMRLLWLPAWFSPRFNTRTLDAKQQNVFSRSMGSEGGTSLGRSSLVEGLCGSTEACEELKSILRGLEEYTDDTVDEVLRGYFRDLGPVPFLYELRQERKKGGVDEEGKPVYVRGQYMEVAAIEHLTESSLKKLAKRLQSNRDRIAKAEESGAEPPVLTVARFDPEDFGFDGINFPADAEPAWASA